MLETKVCTIIRTLFFYDELLTVKKNLIDLLFNFVFQSYKIIR